MYLNPSLTFYFKMFNLPKAGIVALWLTLISNVNIVGTMPAYNMDIQIPVNSH